MLPLFVDMTAKKVVVFGAGPVGLRKANFFAREAEVVIVARSFIDGLDPKIRMVKADVRAEMEMWIEWADLVVAATDDREINDRIVTEAERRGRLCNRADGISTFLIPSVVEKDGYVVAISTLGRSPGMAKYLRLKLERELGTRYGLMVCLQEELRELVRERLASSSERERFLWSVLQDEEVWTLLEKEYGRARDVALARLEE